MQPNAQRRTSLSCSEGWIRDFLHRSPIAHIATCWAEQPFITPTTFWYDEQRQKIVFHSNIAGRIRSNVEQFTKVCIETSEFGRLLPSNVALEFSLQYASVVVFGIIQILKDAEEKRRALYGLIGKYFPDMSSGNEYRPITVSELERTSVYAVRIESWSGKKNWPERAKQSDQWKPLASEAARTVSIAEKSRKSSD
ncbi:MAG: pyridoxamine 5'-phosphate oxidase family protein [Ignavibacteria bacterium]|nr:pyridoxamine 5'-phosphate oxidase family protein [Ignavibacteria bacterium]